MYDAVLQFSEIAQRRSTILEDLAIKPKEYLLATVHRPYNTDIPGNLQNILSAFLEINEPIIFPVHPRTRQKLTSLPAHLLKSLILIPPVGYLDMLMLEQNAKAILTDSGGMQKKAYFFGVPCVTMRTETEWVETVETGWNVVVGADHKRIVESVRCLKPDKSRPELYGDGRAAEKIISLIESKGLVKKGNSSTLKTSCHVVATSLFYDINRYGGIPYIFQYAELARQDPTIRKKWLRTVRMLSPSVKQGKFNELGVNLVLDSFGVSKDDILTNIQKQLEQDPNKEEILRNFKLKKNPT